MFCRVIEQLQISKVLGWVMNCCGESLERFHAASKGRLALAPLAEHPVLMRMDTAMEWTYATHNPCSLSELRLRDRLNLRKYTKFLDDNALNIILARAKTVAALRRDGRRCWNSYHEERKFRIINRSFKRLRKVVTSPFKSSIRVIFLVAQQLLLRGGRH